MFATTFSLAEISIMYPPKSRFYLLLRIYLIFQIINAFCKFSLNSRTAIVLSHYHIKPKLRQIL